METLDERIRTEIERRVKLYELAATDEALQAAMWVRSSRDPRFWVENFAWTFDPRRPPYRLPWIPFDFQWEIFFLFLGIGSCARDSTGKLWPIVLDKARDMGVTEIAIKALVWGWMFERAGRFGVISRTQDEVDDGSDESLFGKLRWTIRQQPWWMRPRGYHLKKRHKYLDKHKMIINPDNDNIIAGASTVGSAFRSRRYRWVFVDEAAFIPFLAQLLGSLNNVCDAVRLVSTPNGREHFARIVHGKVGTVVPYGQDGLGWCHYRCEYQLDPRKTDAWFKRQQARCDPEVLAQEVLIDYDASAPGRLWESFSRRRHLLRPKGFAIYEPWVADGILYEGWDFGDGPSLTAVVWAVYWPATDVLMVIDYRSFHRMRPKDVAAHVGKAGFYCESNQYGRLPKHRVGDPSMSHPTADQRSWRLYMKDYGIHLRWKKRNVEYTHKLVDTKLAEGKIQFAPACAKRQDHNEGLPTLIESIEQFRRGAKTSSPHEHTGRTPKRREDIFSHLCDALCYIADWVWPRVIQGTGKRKKHHATDHRPRFRAAS